MRTPRAYAAILAALLSLDFLWLSFVARGAYQAAIGPLLLPGGRLLPAIVFYLLYALGVLVFVVQPSADRSLSRTLGRAALFGLVAYAAYDLTNLATLRSFPAWLAALDLTWGAALTAAAAFAGRAAFAGLAKPSGG